MIRIKEYQFSTLENFQGEAFAVQLSDILRRACLDHACETEAQAWQATIRNFIVEARNYGLLSEQDIGAYCVLVLERGLAVHWPKNIEATLLERGLSARIKLQRLYHWLQMEPEPVHHLGERNHD